MRQNTANEGRDSVMQVFSVNADKEINIPPINQPYKKPSLAIDFMAKNKEAKEKIKNESPIYDSGICDVAWQIHDLVKNKTDFVLFPRKDALACSNTFHNPDTPEIKYIISQSLIQMHMIAESKVHVFSYYVCPQKPRVYWVYRGIYTLVQQLKSTLPITESTSLQNGTKLTISGDAPVYLSVWAKAIE